jgi:hypothetical protein
MRITPESMYLIEKICTNIKIPPIQLTSYTYDVIFHLVNQIIHADKTLPSLWADCVYNLNVIDIPTTVPKPILFKGPDFPKEILAHINTHMKLHIAYSFQIHDMKVFTHFIVDEPFIHIDEFNRYVDLIMMWLTMLKTYAGHRPKKDTLYLYFYFTPLPKQIPNVGETIDKIHVNTGMTFIQTNPMEIVIFRREEWFKVFIHETIHSFNIDFSHTYSVDTSNKIRSLFVLQEYQSRVELFEAYSEFWANIINALFCSFLHTPNKKNVDMINNWADIMNSEIHFSIFQMIKILKHMKIHYRDLCDSQVKTLNYKENTPVLSYYIIKTILLYNFQEFLYWTNSHNDNLLKIKEDTQTQSQLCDFIQKYFTKKTFLKKITDIERMYSNPANFGCNTYNSYLFTSLRMCMVQVE